MSKTPRTDAMSYSGYDTVRSATEWARQLERELTDLKAELQGLKDMTCPQCAMVASLRDRITVLLAAEQDATPWTDARIAAGTCDGWACCREMERAYRRLSWTQPKHGGTCGQRT